MSKGKEDRFTECPDELVDIWLDVPDDDDDEDAGLPDELCFDESWNMVSE